MSARLLLASDRVLANRNIRVEVPNPRNAAGEAFASGLEAKGWSLVRQPESLGENRWAFVVRSREEHSWLSTSATMAFEYGAAVSFAVYPDMVKLYDLGEDPSLVEIAVAPLRQAASAVENAVDAVGDRVEGAGRGLGEAAQGIRQMIWLAQVGGIVLGLALIVGGVVYLVRAK